MTVKIQIYIDLLKKLVTLSKNDNKSAIKVDIKF